MVKRQIGWVIITLVIIVDCFVLYNHTDPETIYPLSIISVLVLLLFNSLTIIVDDKFVRFHFGIGVIRWKYELLNIEYCKPISYIPLGWGIRLRPGVILFNVSGTKAIELSVKGKKLKIWIGTDEPAELSDFINSKIQNK
jgi:hypothetical protein